MEANLDQKEISTHETMWKVLLFGGIKATKNSNTITQFRTTRSALLLARLATNPSKFHPREELAYWLWPEEEERQRQLLRLRGELSEIRTTLGEDVIDKQGNTSVRLIEGIQSDVHQFQNKLLASVRAEQAIFRIPLLREAQALYQGDFLAGFYDDWALLERERLQEAYCDVATRLILDLERTNQRSEAQTLRRNIAHQFPEHPLPPMPLVAVESPLSPIAVIPETGEGFFGRETEIMTIQQWGQDPKGSPLLTLLGPGGMGKTRLSQESLPAAIFVSLAEVMEATTGFFEAIHRALGLPQGDAPVRDQVIHTLKSREKPILILDNFEQIVEGGASLVKSLLADCPNLRLLVTSRRRLGLATEKELWLPALPPTNGVSLFLDRARRARPDFGQSHNAYSVVEEIVALLEGLPLAIELCAARSVVLGPVQIREQLRSQIGFLVNRRYATVERHRSVRIALDWSLHLLSPELKRVFARLSIFRGGWTLEAAETVCNDCGLSVLDTLDDLQGHSLITVRFDEDENARYDMLVVIREYAEEVLREFGEEELDKTRNAHCIHYLDIAQIIRSLGLNNNLNGMEKQYSKERANFSQIIHYVIDKKFSNQCFSVLDTLGGVLLELGNWTDLLLLTDNLLGCSLLSSEKLRLLGLHGAVKARQGKIKDAFICWEEELQIARDLEDWDTIVRTMWDIVGQGLEQEQKNERISQYLEEGLKIAQEHHFVGRLIRGYTLRGRWHLTQQNNDAAYSDAEKSWDMLNKNPTSIYLKMYLACYIAPIYTHLGIAEKSIAMLHWVLIQEGVETQLFHVARLLDALGENYERNQQWDFALYAYCISMHIHEEYHTWRPQIVNEKIQNLLLVVDKIKGKQALSLAQMPWTEAKEMFLNLTKGSL